MEGFWKYFEEISAIPHGSKNMEKISAYLEKFAIDHELKYAKDDLGDLIIYKPASAGYEQADPVIMQGHMDMVAVAEPGCTIDMKTEGLRLMTEGDYIYAEGTSLGGDDGVAVAYMLQILADDSIKSPAIEVVLTVDEEIGMYGAKALDYSLLSGHRMINIDNEKEGQMITGCAGGCTVNTTIEYKPVPVGEDYCIYSITLEGGLGGHSGMEIDKKRANCNILAGRILGEIIDTGCMLINIRGGIVDNAIPGENKTVVAVKNGYDICQMTKDIVDKILDEYKKTDPNLTITIKPVNERYLQAMDHETTVRFIKILTQIPDGVQSMSADIDGLVQTSLNLGVLSMSDHSITMKQSIRSSSRDEKIALRIKIESIMNDNRAVTTMEGDYPGWKYAPKSPLRDMMVRLYWDMYGQEPVVEAIHAGLECGYFTEGIPGLECVSIGPDIFDIHSPQEKLSISSSERTYDYICRVLENLK